jgi:hypothetical protein
MLLSRKLGTSIEVFFPTADKRQLPPALIRSMQLEVKKRASSKRNCALVEPRDLREPLIGSSRGARSEELEGALGRGDLSSVQDAKDVCC